MPTLPGKRYWTVLSLAIILFALGTAEYSIDFQDGVWSNSNLWGFPLPYAHYGVATSMEEYIYAIPLIIDLLAYLLIASFVTIAVEALGLGRYLSRLSVPMIVAALAYAVLAFLSSLFGYWQLYMYGDPVHFEKWTWWMIS